MEINQIHRLLAKYFEGNTTLEEEKILHEYFAGAIDMNTEMVAMKKQFELFYTARELRLNTDDLELRILDNIDKYEQQSRPATRKLNNLTRLLIAASIALIIGLSGVMYLKNQQKTTQDTFTDPQIAYLETQKALLYISQKMNKGIEPLSNIDKINTGSRQLRHLNKMDESMGMLNLVSFINQSSNLKK